MEEMQSIAVPGAGNFQFSATKLDNLGATEYTLVTVVIDTTGSTYNFADNLLDCLKSIVEACKKSPHAENLMLRVLTFNTQINEVHGFKLLSTVDINDYKKFNPNGLTALYDAAYSAIGAMATYAKNLSDQEFGVNGAVYIITDGCDNHSQMTPSSIAMKLREAINNEYLESQVSCLIGLKDPNEFDPSWGATVTRKLTEFQVEAELTEFIEIGDATPGQLAKLVNFVSSSVNSQFQALGTGGPSQPVTF